jgi:hypothetical protein
MEEREYNSTIFLSRHQMESASRPGRYIPKETATLQEAG